MSDRVSVLEVVLLENSHRPSYLGHVSVLHIQHLIIFFQQHCGVGTVIIPILQMNKLGLRETE